LGVFGGALARSGSSDGVNNVAAKGASGKAGGVDGGEWRALGIRREQK
jgi:hypothetical protein